MLKARWNKVVFFSLKDSQARELTVLNLIPGGFQDLLGESLKKLGLIPELALLVWAGGVTTDLPKSLPHQVTPSCYSCNVRMTRTLTSKVQHYSAN